MHEESWIYEMFGKIQMFLFQFQYHLFKVPHEGTNASALKSQP